MKVISNDVFFSQVESDLLDGRSVCFKVKGNSMFPLLRNGKDIVFVSPVNQSIVKNDVVLFKYKGKHVLHRVILTDGESFTLQGDGVYASKEYCCKEDIIGVVAHISRGGGKKFPIKSFNCRLYICLWNAVSFMRKYLLFIISKF